MGCPAFLGSDGNTERVYAMKTVEVVEVVEVSAVVTAATDAGMKLAVAVKAATPKKINVEITGKDPGGKRQLRANKAAARTAANEAMGISRAVPAYLRRLAAPAVDLGLIAAGYKTKSQLTLKPAAEANLAAAIKAVNATAKK